jgi:hypothetical protein
VSDSPQCPPDRCVACWYHQPRQGGHGPDLRDLRTGHRYCHEHAASLIAAELDGAALPEWAGLPCAMCRRGEHDDCDNGYPDLAYTTCKCDVCEDLATVADAAVAQRSERPAHNGSAAGSTPARRTHRMTGIVDGSVHCLACKWSGWPENAPTECCGEG